MVSAAGAHFGHVFCTPGLVSPVHATGSFAARRTGTPPHPDPYGTTNISAAGWSYIVSAAGTALNAMSLSSGENAGKYSFMVELDAPGSGAAKPPPPPP